jgi:threonine/homoserine/homoserine lactone efflux protein
VLSLPDAPRLALFFAAAAALLLTPGPAVLYIVARSGEQGRRAGLLSALGIGLGTLVHVAAAALGLSALLVSSALAFSTVKYLGALYLIFLGVRRLTAKEAPEESREARPRASKRWIFVEGILVNVLNPKTALFFLAFLPQFVDPARPMAAQIASLGLLFAVLGVASDSGWALAAGSAAGWLRRSPKIARRQRYVTGGIYIGLGLLAALTPARKP